MIWNSLLTSSEVFAIYLQIHKISSVFISFTSVKSQKFSEKI
jgi:hypothetical protein